MCHIYWTHNLRFDWSSKVCICYNIKRYLFDNRFCLFDVALEMVAQKKVILDFTPEFTIISTGFPKKQAAKFFKFFL